MSNHGVAYTRYMDKDAIFRALCDSTRRLMLDELSERNEMTLYELTARLIMKHDLSISRGVADINQEYKRLLENGVTFTMEPTKMGELTIAVFDDTCGNLIQIIQK